jgi:diaminopimelate decarboxylase
MIKNPKFLVSGFYSGPSPSAGLGIAKSIRAAWPQATIIGMDYWNGSSGLHDASLSDRLVFPSWDLLDLDSHLQTLTRFGEDHLLLSSLDVEIAWLASTPIRSENLLIPSKNSLSFAQKPHVLIGDFLPFRKPKFYLDRGDDQELFDFCRDQSWRIWVKGPYHGAKYVSSWRELTQARDAISRDGRFGLVSYQQHVRGVEESICFSAYNGQLCGAVHMQKKVTTPEGKTWSGKVRPLSPDQTEILAESVRKTKWTGGGELELIRDESDQYWLMEFNPRFPAWIHGATISGINLPALLIQARLGIESTATITPLSNEFTRIVTEIPVLKGISLPQVQHPTHGDIGMTGKYGASYSALEEKISESYTTPALQSTQQSSELPDLKEQNFWRDSLKTIHQTPKRINISPVIAENFAKASSLQSLVEDNCRMIVGYSIKTCPDEDFLKAAHASGLSAEAISMAEVEAALRTGWTPDQIILNGPAKWWPRTMKHHDGLKAVFCDSKEEFERLLKSGRRDRTWGFRLKIPGFNSRFGTELESFEDIKQIVELIESMPRDIDLGFHIHLASNLIGNTHWEDAVHSAVNWAQTIALQSQRTVSMLDLGGGYHPRDFERFDWKRILNFVHHEIPTLKSLVIEPGRALSQNTALMVTSIQDIRKKRGRIQDVVVDTCISELPLSRVYPHRMFIVKGDRMIPLGQGFSRMLGRICMEDDILAESINFPPSITIGDRIIIADAGAYERSMSYEFGYGRVSPTM